MYVSSPTDPGPEAAATARATPRAGLRCPPPQQQPTGAFVVIEMIVLVLVIALAMVTIIVTAGETERNEPTARPTPRSESRPAPTAEDAIGMRPTRTFDAHRPGVAGASR